jgi:rRNA pseudouridine-1189 N-methylase Emg1 (Nep1/Mra1 family)
MVRDSVNGSYAVITLRQRVHFTTTQTKADTATVVVRAGHHHADDENERVKLGRRGRKNRCHGLLLLV